MNKFKEWLINLFKKKEEKVKLYLALPTKPSIQRVLLEHFVGIEPGWYILRLCEDGKRWEIITGPER